MLHRGPRCAPDRPSWCTAPAAASAPSWCNSPGPRGEGDRHGLHAAPRRPAGVGRHPGRLPRRRLPAQVRKLAPGGVDAVFDHVGGQASSTPGSCSPPAAPSSPTAAPARSMTPPPCCPSSCGCWRTGVLELPAHAQARELLQRLAGGRASQAGGQARRVPGAAAHRSTHLFGLLRDGALTAKIAARYRWPTGSRPWNWPSPPAGPPSARSSWCHDGAPAAEPIPP